MTEISPNRITYERLGILVSDFPAYKTQGSTFQNLIRVQDVNYAFSHPALDIKSIGSDNLVARDGESPIVRQADVNCDMSYLFSSGENEEAIGLHLGPSYTIMKNFFDEQDHDDVNLMIVVASDACHADLNHIEDQQKFEGYNVIGVGNCFLNNYAYQASVGQLPSVSISYDASNMKFDTYEDSNPPTLPSIKLGVDNQFSSEVITINKNTFDPGEVPGANVVMPGDILVEITKKAGNYGGVPLEKVNAAIQNISIEVPIERQTIYGFGSNYVFDRKLKLPIIGSSSIDMIVREFDEGQIDSFFTQGSMYDMVIKHNSRNFEDGEVRLASTVNTFKIEDAQLKQQNYTAGIQGELSVSTSFSFGISSTKGLKLYRQ